MSKKELVKALTIMVIVVVIVSVSIVSVLYFLKKPDGAHESKSLYSDKAVEVMKEYKLYDELNNNYSKTVEFLLESKDFKKEYLDDYYDIEYANVNDFGKVINTLLDKKYKSTEINYLISNQIEDLDILLDMDYVNILDFKDISNFRLSNLERYLSYRDEHQDYDLETIVTYVNIGLDLEGYSEYSDYMKEEAFNDLTILVNKYHKLADDYEPEDLVRLSYSGNTDRYRMRKAAAEAFEELTSAALIDNVVFYPFSAYRSFETQSVLYNRYKASDGEKVADTYSARPGFSEHQLGLAVDVRSSTLSDNLTKEHYEWMLDNSYKYGFIVRYPKGKQHITQYIEEPWHIRYLGVELATKVHDSGLTYDEYYDIYMSN
ncbi:MAG: M15 family metallopeptidase [Ruminococcus sp.]|nr:M15 family metallopeptidase [Ruminococcus sp.]